MMQEKNSAGVTDSVSGRPTFYIRGRLCGDKTLPSLNQYLQELGKSHKDGIKFKQKYIRYVIDAIRRDLKRFKTSKPVILHYTFYEPNKGQKRDLGNIFSLCDKFVEDALRNCKVIPDDNPMYVRNFTHEFYYTDGIPYIKVEIEELDV